MTKVEQKSYSFAKIKERATKGVVPVDPFVLSDLDPPLVVEAPTTYDQQVVLARLITPSGQYDMRDADEIMAAFCGAVYPRLRELVADQDVAVFGALTSDMIEHFKEAIEAMREEASSQAKGPGSAPVSD